MAGYIASNIVKGKMVVLTKELANNEALRNEHIDFIQFKDTGEKVFAILSNYTWIIGVANVLLKPVPVKDRMARGSDFAKSVLQPGVVDDKKITKESV